MATQRFELIDDGSANFWEVTIDGSCFTQTYGKVGTSGKSKTKEMASAAAAYKEVAKLVRAKKRKGYLKVNPKKYSQVSVNEKADLNDNTDDSNRKCKTTGIKKRNLTQEQTLKLRILLRSLVVENVQMAIEIIHSVDASEEEWSEAFSSQVLGMIVSTWDIQLWNLVTNATHCRKEIFDKFIEFAIVRFLNLSGVKKALFLQSSMRSGCNLLTPIITSFINDYEGAKYLQFIESISDEIVGSLHHLKGEINLNGLTILSDAAAESLAKHRGDLHLNGLTSISDAAAERLAKHRGGLHLNGLTSISDAAAERLANHQGDLDLRGLSSLSDAAAESLAKNQGDLALDGLTSLSDAVADSLAKHKGNLGLSRITNLTDTAAESLSKHQGDHLDLSGLTSLSDSRGHILLVESLSKQKGGLDLGGLTSLSDAAAESLAKHQGDLNLNGLSSLSNVAAKALGNHKGTLFLNALKKITVSGIENLCKHDDLVLNNQKTLEKLKTARQSFENERIKIISITIPNEFAKGSIVLSNPPADPLSGEGYQGEEVNTAASWWLPKKVINWFTRKLDPRHKKIRACSHDPDSDYINQTYLLISFEAAALLRKNATEWLFLCEQELSSIDKHSDKITLPKAPKGFQNDEITLPPPKRPLKWEYYWKPDFNGENYQSVLNYYSYLPDDHVGRIFDQNGYPAKIMSPEAAKYYKENREFWEAKYALVKLARKDHRKNK
jgi:predicted DNA-binding WGR domain protein